MFEEIVVDEEIFVDVEPSTPIASLASEKSCLRQRSMNLEVEQRLEYYSTISLSFTLSDNEHFFVYALRLKGEDYKKMKNEQRLLVEIEDLPGFIKDFLEEVKKGKGVFKGTSSDGETKFRLDMVSKSKGLKHFVLLSLEMEKLVVWKLAQYLEEMNGISKMTRGYPYVCKSLSREVSKLQGDLNMLMFKCYNVMRERDEAVEELEILRKKYCSRQEVSSRKEEGIKEIGREEKKYVLEEVVCATARILLKRP
ncbi:unnamed protein product [Enterobius vermicularis]|uniref:SAS-6_N domain-containing protein n=1 Tax=Enterobius vermicularis TaxID=51028 RepID=A0A0N4USJ7_ENTVE|nr:unnamed protein product [Enterobius vermicularis]